MLAAAEPGLSEPQQEFIDRHCSSCHNDVDREGGLDLSTLSLRPGDAANLMTWVKVYDRVQTGEMPPKEKRQPGSSELNGFLKDLRSTLIAGENSTRTQGRALWRRLNRSEYEMALRDIFALPWLDVQPLLPVDGEAHHFSKSSSALDLSFVHMQKYMAAAEAAMLEALAVQFSSPPTSVKRYYARETGSFTSGDVSFRLTPFTGFTPERLKFPLLGSSAQPDVRANKAPITVGASDPDVRAREAVGWVAGHHIIGFSTGWSGFVAPVSGKYRVRFNGLSVWVGPNGHGNRLRGTGKARTSEPTEPRWYTANYDDVSVGRRSEAIVVYTQSEKRTALNRRVGMFDLHPDASTAELDVTLKAKEFLVTDAVRFYRVRPTDGSSRGPTNPLAQRDGQPAVAFRWMEVEGPLYDSNHGAGYRLLFGDLPLQEAKSGRKGVAIQVVRRLPPELVEPAIQASDVGLSDYRLEPVRVEVVSDNPRTDAGRLLRNFVSRVYRRPVSEREIDPFVALAHRQLDSGAGFTAAMLASYTAVLASAEFVVLNEKPGNLDGYALASRLAFFLWNSEPDDELKAAAARGELAVPERLHAQVERMLNSAKAARFVSAFLDGWLDLSKMDDTTPSLTLYPEYVLDQWLVESAVDETRLYFSELLQHNLPARTLVDSDFTFLNERLASHYGISGVTGAAMRRVALPADSPRGGLMTQASVLKVTAAGTTTSPVLRGKWIMERILGYVVPPPPAAVPAVEPDIRGSVTIRQQLDKHRADESCAMCHRKIDPPGFALENFDVLGGWRERYRAVSAVATPEHGIGHNGHPFSFYYSQPVDPSGRMPDGTAFEGIKDFKRLLLRDEAQLARNLTVHLVTYATGVPISFADRDALEKILERSRSRGYGVRTLVHEIVQSDLFRSK